VLNEDGDCNLRIFKEQTRRTTRGPKLEGIRPYRPLKSCAMRTTWPFLSFLNVNAFDDGSPPFARLVTAPLRASRITEVSLQRWLPFGFGHGYSVRRVPLMSSPFPTTWEDKGFRHWPRPTSSLRAEWALCDISLPTAIDRVSPLYQGAPRRFCFHDDEAQSPIFRGEGIPVFRPNPNSPAYRAIRISSLPSLFVVRGGGGGG